MPKSGINGYFCCYYCTFDIAATRFLHSSLLPAPLPGPDQLPAPPPFPIPVASHLPPVAWPFSRFSRRCLPPQSMLPAFTTQPPFELAVPLRPSLYSVRSHNSPMRRSRLREWEVNEIGTYWRLLLYEARILLGRALRNLQTRLSRPIAICETGSISLEVTKAGKRLLEISATSICTSWPLRVRPRCDGSEMRRKPR
jgi:hypothetical protein